MVIFNYFLCMLIGVEYAPACNIVDYVNQISYCLMHPFAPFEDTFVCGSTNFPRCTKEIIVKYVLKWLSVSN